MSARDVNAWRGGVTICGVDHMDCQPPRPSALPGSHSCVRVGVLDCLTLHEYIVSDSIECIECLFVLSHGFDQ